MNLIHLFWAKKIRQPSLGEVNQYHPLLFHLIDVAVSAEALLRSGIGSRLVGALGLEPTAGVKWLVFWAGLHDIGKLCAGFQYMWPEHARRLEKAGFTTPLGYKAFPHGVISAVVLRNLLPGLGMDTGSASRLAVILGGHHGRFPMTGSLHHARRRAIGLEQSNWGEFRKKLFDHLACLLGIKGLPIPSVPDSAPFFIQLAGFVCLADWIGSISEPGFFQFEDPAIPAEEYLEQTRLKAVEILKRLHWVGWSPSTDQLDMDTLFPFLKGKDLYPVQSKAVEIRNRLGDPGMVVIEAPMGQGKTEAALFLADAWSVNLKQPGCYFALPTQATSNQMFGRLCGFLNQRYPDQMVNMQLLHGHAALSAEFEILMKRGPFLPEPGLETDEKNRGPAESVFAAEWFTYKKRGLLAPFGVGTVDQILMAVLQTRHYFLRLFGLAGKTIIIDEVHAYDAYMTTHLKNLLSWLAALGCSVVLLSATLPRNRRLGLIEAFEQGLGVDGPADFQEAGYPRCTWTGSGGRESYPVKAGTRRCFSIEQVDGGLPAASGDEFPLGLFLSQALSGGGCAAVIVNTVDKAQQVFRALKKYFPNPDAGDGFPELDLFHARFPFQERADREARTLKRFGKPDAETERPWRAVLVATQVIEQSLDLDFDLMVSEMAPVDLLLQRIGRLHRHERPRPGELNASPRLVLIRPEQVAPVLHFGTGTEAVYDRLILLKSWLVLRGRNEITLPDDLEPLIEAVYEGEDEPEFTGFEAEIQQAQGDHMAREQCEEIQALVKAAPDPHVSDFLEELVEDLVEDDPAAHPAVSALTRLSRPTVNIVVLWNTEEAPWLDPDGRPVDLSEKPGPSLARELLMRSLSLSLAGVVPLLLERDPPAGWALSAWLRHYRPLLLNDKGQAVLGSYTLTLHPELGLVVVKEKE